MSKVKYKFNKKSLTFTRVQITIWKRLLLLFSHLSLGFVFGVAALIYSFNYLDSPKEKVQKREIDKIKFQYQMLNDHLGDLNKLLSELQYKDDNVYRIIFETAPISDQLRQSDVGGNDKDESLAGYPSSNLLIQTRHKMDKILWMTYVQSKSFDEITNLAKNKEKMLSAIPAIQPVSMKEMRRIAEGFGVRRNSVTRALRFHKGIDFDAATGTPVYATGNGVITEAGFNSGGYGNCIKINHGYSYETLYGHLSRIFVKPGQRIQRGQIIGYVGSTGYSSGPHLHYEVYKNGIAIDPIYFFFNDLTSEQFQKILELSSNPTQTMD